MNPNDIDKQIDRAISAHESEHHAKSRQFKPPTLNEVKAYIAEKGCNVDAGMFWNFYESKGWMIGKNKMKKWHSAVATWQKSLPPKPAVKTVTCFICHDKATAQIESAYGKLTICTKCNGLLNNAPLNKTYKGKTIPKHSMDAGQLEIMILNQKSRR